MPCVTQVGGAGVLLLPPRFIHLVLLMLLYYWRYCLYYFCYHHKIRLFNIENPLQVYLFDVRLLLDSR